MHYVLFYDVVDGFIERRAPFRDAHLGLVRAAHARGEMIMAGALADPADTSLLVFRSDTPAVAERFAENDPYVREGLVKAWRVRRWDLAVGGE